MKEIVLNKYDDKKYNFLTYFVINHGKLFSPSNFNFEDNLQNCFYIRKLGSNVHPKIYLDTKLNNKWVSGNQLIGDYNALMDFIVQNQNAFICIRGFSRASIYQFIRMINEVKKTNIKPVKFADEKLKLYDELEIAEQYPKISNSLFGKNRHNSKQKIMQLKRK